MKSLQVKRSRPKVIAECIFGLFEKIVSSINTRKVIWNIRVLFERFLILQQMEITTEDIAILQKLLYEISTYCSKFPVVLWPKIFFWVSPLMIHTKLCTKTRVLRLPHTVSAFQLIMGCDLRTSFPLSEVEDQFYVNASVCLLEL